VPDQVQPLVGRRIVVTRAGEAGQRLAAQLRDLGAVPIVCPAITIRPPHDLAPFDATLTALETYDWLVCTSVNAVTALLDRLPTARGGLRRPRHVRIGAVGNATAAALRAAGWEPDCVPTTQTAAALADALGDVAGQRILFPASELARPDLTETLRPRGAIVTVVTAYRTIAAPPVQTDALKAQLHTGAIDAVTFTSPSTVRGFLPLLAGVLPNTQRPAIICIGPVTAAAARDAGLLVAATAAAHSTVGLLGALCDHFNADDRAKVSVANTNKGAQSCSI
jgi:uroporphyrinogen III methyltransferase/synthase